MAEKFRQILRQSIVCFFILAVFFLACIFLLTIAHHTALKNKIYDKVPIQQQEISTWGQIPGDLQFSWNRTYAPYQLQYNPTPEASIIALESTTPTTYTVDRNFAQAAWYPQKSVVSYNTEYTLTDQAAAAADDENDETYNMINLGAYDVWYQMVNKPKFFKSWQAMTQAYELMLNSNYINRFYAYNVYYYYFSDAADVKKYVLVNLSAEDQTKVYEDPDYGLSTVKGLAGWCAAAAEPSPTMILSSAPALIMKAYWTAQGVTLSDTDMTLLVGNGSQLRAILMQTKYALISDPALGLNTRSDFLTDTLASQWGNAGVTQEPNNYMEGVSSVYSISDLTTGSASDQATLPSDPEFGAFVLDPKKGNSIHDNTIPYPQASYDFNRNVLSYTTFLNLDSMRSFYDAYTTKDESLMTSRFGLNSTEKVTLFYNYLDDMVENFLVQGGNYQVIPLSHLMYKHTNQTLKFLNETLPLDLTTRVMAGKIKTSGNDCTYYFNQAGVDPATTICENQDFTDPNILKFYIEAPWYEGDYTTKMKTQTGITDTQYMSFYDLNADVEENSFGLLMTQTLTEIANQYKCAEAAACATVPLVSKIYCNCTAPELSSLQWGSLGVTQNPADGWNLDYVPKVESVYEWGQDQPSWLPYGELTDIIEYPITTAASLKDYDMLPWTASQAMMTDSISTGSLTSNFAWQSLLIPYFKEDATKTSEYQTLYGFDAEQLGIFINNMRKAVQRRFFGDSFASYTMDQMLMGFENDVADKINGGDYLLGDDFGLSKYTTPIINDQLGPGKSVNFGLYTGSNGNAEIGLLRIINDAAYTNKLTTIYTGNATEFVDVAQHDPNMALSMQELQDVSYGMQFPPEIETDDQLKTYDQRNNKIVTYTHSESQKIGGNNIKLEKFTTSSLGDVGFAYNLPVFEKEKGCYMCYVNATAFKDVTIDGNPYTESTSPSENYLTVQPDSGYTYEMKKESTVYMIHGGNLTVEGLTSQATPLPGLDVLYGQPFPLYEFSENLQMNRDAFINKFDYIGTAGQQTKACEIAFSVLATLALILGIVAIVVYKMKDPKRNVDYTEENVVENTSTGNQ